MFEVAFENNPDLSDRVPELLIHTAVNQNKPIFSTCVQNELFNQQCTFQKHNIVIVKVVESCSICTFIIQVNEVTGYISKAVCPPVATSNLLVFCIYFNLKEH